MRVGLVACLSLLMIGSAVAQEDGLPNVEKPLREDVSADFSYEERFIEVFDTRIRYFDEGEGDPVIFVHGIPTWSYIWRNIMPHLEGTNRVIAVDMPGFGGSSLGAADTYAEQIHYFERFVELLALENITLVGQDLGGGVALNYAARHPDNVVGMVLMEAPIRQYFTDAPLPDMQFPTPAGGWADWVTAMRNPEQAHQIVVEQNAFFGDDNSNLTRGMARRLTEEEIAAYADVFVDPERRAFLSHFPRDVPVDGVPASTYRTTQDAAHWLLNSDTPKLVFYVDPGDLMPPEFVAGLESRVPSIETVFLGSGRHFVQEDYPHVIGNAIADWLPRARQRYAMPNQVHDRVYMLNVLTFRNENGPTRYLDYIRAISPVMQEYGGRLFTSYVPVEDFEGGLDADLVGVVEWPSLNAVRGFFSDPRYLEVEYMREEALSNLQLIRMEPTTEANDPFIPR